MSSDRLFDVRDDSGSVPPFHAELEKQDSAVVVAASGEIDMVSEPALREHLDAALATQPPVVVVDLTDVSFMGSGGLSALLRARQQAEAQQTDVRVVASDRAVVRPIEATGVDQMLGVYRSREEAFGQPSPLREA